MHSDSGTGSSLDRVVHLFASGAKAPEQTQRTEVRNQPTRFAKACYILSAGGGIAQTFYVCNLGTCLGERGLNFALLDFETRLPTATYLFGSLAEEPTIADIVHPHAPPWDALYDIFTEKHIIINGQWVVKVVSLSKDGAEAFSKGPVESRTIQSLKRFLDDQDLTLINLPLAMVEGHLLREVPVGKFLFVTKPDLKDVMRTFDLIRKVSELVPSGAFGLLVHRAKDIADVRSTFTSLARAVRANLGKDLRFMGQFPENPLIAKSVLNRTPLVLDESYSELRRRFLSLSAYIANWVLPIRRISNSDEAVAL